MVCVCMQNSHRGQNSDHSCTYRLIIAVIHIVILSIGKEHLATASLPISKDANLGLQQNIFRSDTLQWLRRATTKCCCVCGAALCHACLPCSHPMHSALAVIPPQTPPPAAATTSSASAAKFPSHECHRKRGTHLRSGGAKHLVERECILVAIGCCQLHRHTHRVPCQ